MYSHVKKIYENNLKDIENSGLWKDERIVITSQDNIVDTTEKKGLLNLCANNYLGLSSDINVIKIAQKSYEKWGYGLSSVRFIVGTQQVHKDLEKAVSQFLCTEDTILYSSCFDANGGLFETILTKEDAVISDELNHASIIDGIRLCSARKYKFANNDMKDLEKKLQEADADGVRIKLIATDGVFSMDGTIANLKGICDLADQYDALVMVDDSHATGFIGKTGRGTPEYNSVMDRVDIITSTFGKALGGASGGFTSGKKEIINLLRQKSRPYLFSNSLAPAIAETSLYIIKMIMDSTERKDKLEKNVAYFREEMTKMGFNIKEGTHPIVPIMLGDARLAKEMSERMMEKGIYVIGFYFPVVPKGKARVRTQISAAHSTENIELALQCFKEVKEEMGI